MQNELTARLHRYARALPESDSIPIAYSERLELAALIHATVLRPQQLTVAEILNSLDNGTFRFAGHRVVIL